MREFLAPHGLARRNHIEDPDGQAAKHHQRLIPDVLLGFAWSPGLEQAIWLAVLGTAAGAAPLESPVRLGLVLSCLPQRTGGRAFQYVAGGREP